MIKYIISFSVLIALCLGNYHHEPANNNELTLSAKSGNCAARNLTGQVNFDINQFAGKWYEIERYRNGLQDGECVTVTYEPSNDTVVTITATRKLDNGTTNVAVAESVAIIGNVTAILELDFSYGADEIKYIILTTDYTGWAIIWRCVNISDDYSVEFLWLLSRTSTLTTAQRAAVDAYYEEHKLNTEVFVTDVQTPEYCNA